MENDAAKIEITVNGETRRVQSGVDIDRLLRELGLDPRLVVVEHNGDILDRARLADIDLRAGDVLELVHFVGGG